ncbi:hypothetical protein IWQ60_002836 [Tieghemiomyces parasiticus]|uniref:Seipin n=1 Tax=Tieghemiomyces parasiticus TaxID=78921 RepID=A0A9W8AE13_9FUNG|nr:hypothetical protein IWQ60_002836 [Tieghemiomyces parasiticus]
MYLINKFCRWSAADAQRVKYWTVRLVAGSAALTVATAFALASYGAFYYFFIPRLSHQLPVYLDYSAPMTTTITTTSAAPLTAVAYVPISPDGSSRIFTSAQGYRVSLHLTLPTSPTNRAQDNFMVGVELLDAQNATAYAARRPGLLPYRSTATRLGRTILRALPLALGWIRETESLRLVLLEDMRDDGTWPITHMYVTLGNRRIQTYSIVAHFDVQYTGLRYYMYYWSVPTAAFFVCLSVVWQAFAALVSWRVLDTYASNLPLPSPRASSRSRHLPLESSRAPSPAPGPSSSSSSLSRRRRPQAIQRSRSRRNASNGSSSSIGRRTPSPQPTQFEELAEPVRPPSPLSETDPEPLDPVEATQPILTETQVVSTESNVAALPAEDAEDQVSL